MKKRAANNESPELVSAGGATAPAADDFDPETTRPTGPADDVVRAVVRRWPVIALIAAAVTLLVWLATALQPKRYRAVAIAAVTPTADQLSPSELIRGVDTLERRVVPASLAALASAPVMRRAVAVGADYDIRAAVMPNTNLFRIEVEGRDPARTAAIANQIPALLSAHARAMYTVYGVTLRSAAEQPTAAALPRVGRAIVAGLALGLLLGLAAAYVLEKRPALLSASLSRPRQASVTVPPPATRRSRAVRRS